MKKPNATKRWFQRALRDPALRRQALSDCYYRRTVIRCLLIVFAVLSVLDLVLVFADGNGRAPIWGLIATLLGLSNAGLLHARNQLLIAALESLEENSPRESDTPAGF